MPFKDPEVRKAKAREYSKRYAGKWKVINPDRYVLWHRRNRLKKYGLTPECKAAMYASQDGKCKICRDVVEEGSSHVDHDHATGKVRDLLCVQCNHMLGQAKDNPEILRVAAFYLESHQMQENPNGH